MVNRKLKLTMVGIILTIAFVSKVFCQNPEGYFSLKKYQRLGFVTGLTHYNRAKLEPQYGDYTFENKTIWSFSAGFEYDFYPENKWSFITGFIVSLEPAYNIVYHFKKEDIYPQYNDDWEDKALMYAIPSFSVPFLIRLNIQAAKKLFINFRTGVRMMYFPPGYANFSLTFHNADNTESKEVFGLKLNSPDNLFQGSFIIGAGSSYAFKRLLLKMNIIYVMNFQNIMEGEYLFDNLSASPRSYGYYKLSGNYIGLLFTVNPAKKKVNK